MAEMITARDANHHFARLLREVQAGREFVVTRNGVAVARLIPARTDAGGRKLTPAQEAALARTLERLRNNRGEGTIGRFDRNEAYDDARGWMKPQ